MSFGKASIINPDGRKIPDHLWPELAAIVALEPEPELLSAWVRRIENDLGVRDVHRAFVAGGIAAVAEAIHADKAARGLIIDAFSRVDETRPWPGENADKTGHALAAKPDDDDKLGRRTYAVRPGDENLAWYIARAATMQEKRAEANLIEAGYAVYVPRLVFWRRLSRIRKRAERALFQGYFFVGLNAKQAIGEMIELDGVHNVIRIGGVPREVAFPAIEALVRQEVGGEFDKTRRDKRKDPEPGTAVKIIGGKFMGFSAYFCERRDDERIALMLEMFGKMSQPFPVDASDVELPS
jgi:transcriptional antiterminator RfaH